MIGNVLFVVLIVALLIACDIVSYQNRKKSSVSVRRDWPTYIGLGLLLIGNTFVLFFDGPGYSLPAAIPLLFGAIGIYSVALGLHDFWKTRAKFSIRAVLMLTTIIAVYCGVVRWIGISAQWVIYLGLLVPGFLLVVIGGYKRYATSTLKSTKPETPPSQI